MKLLSRLEQLFVRIETTVLVLTLSVMVILAFTQVVLRNVFDTGLLWGDTIVRHLVLWVGFTGAALAACDDRHISIDALSRFLSERLRHSAKVLTSLFAVAVCLLLADASITLFKDEMEFGGELVLGLPSWVGVMILPPGYLFIAFHFLVRAVQNALLVARADRGPGVN
jgi:TRAP-type C4-dicarboxylate transport system permease small subunit